MSDLIRELATAICKSKTCEGFSCCQWPGSSGRANCPVKDGGYDEAAKDALHVLRAPTIVAEAEQKVLLDAVVAARRSYEFSPNSYTASCLNACLAAEVLYRRFPTMLRALIEADYTLTNDDACDIHPLVESDNPHEHAAGLVRAAIAMAIEDGKVKMP